jgi:type IV pilus assembly protein PilF
VRHLLACAMLLVAATAVAAQPAPPSEPPLVTAARLNAQLAVAYLKQNDVVTAREKIEKALTQNPNDAAVQMSAGLVYERLEQPDQADRHFAAALKLDPQNPDMINNYAVFLCRRGHYDQGQKLFEQAARSPSYATPEVAYSNAGVCARSAKNLPQAEDLFRKALAARSDYPDALLQLADLSFERGAALAARCFSRCASSARSATRTLPIATVRSCRRSSRRRSRRVSCATARAVNERARRHRAGR